MKRLVRGETEKMKKIMSAHQPNFLPYLGFFDKMKNSDIFIIRDEVQFTERDWHHRNKIRIEGKDENGKPKSKWLVVPVKKCQDDIKEIVIKNETKEKNVPWSAYLLRQIKSNYETTPFFKEFFPELEGIFLSKKEKLIDLNMDVINYLKKCFDIKTEVVLASKLPRYKKTFEPNQDLINLAKAVQADVYLSGAGGKNYLKREKFENQGVEVRFQEFNHPVYRQRFEGFAPYTSSIDALFNVGNIFENINTYITDISAMKIAH